MLVNLAIYNVWMYTHATDLAKEPSQKSLKTWQKNCQPALQMT